MGKALQLLFPWQHLRATFSDFCGITQTTSHRKAQEARSRTAYRKQVTAFAAVTKRI